MRLSRRLDKLRAEAGHADSRVNSGGTPEFRGETLRDRLARIQTRQRRHAAGTAGSAQVPDTATTLGATELAPGLLEVVVDHPLDQPYGQQPLTGLGAGCPGIAEAAGLAPSRALLLDTETTGLAGGSGTVAFLVGLGRIQDQCLRVRQWLLSGFSGEPLLYERLSAELDGVDGVVTYNGKSFDLPLLRSRARLNGYRRGFDPQEHLDLLYPIRRRYRKHWPNCRLITAEHRLLGQERWDDLPGSEAPAVWLDFLQRGDPRRLVDVLRHNADDIRALAAIWAALAESTPEA